MPPRPPFVDAHLHLWDRDRLRYPWLEEPAVAEIAGTYLLEDWRREVSAWNPVACVHVDAGAHPDSGRAETAWLGTVRADQGMPSAIVARIALERPDVEAELAWQAAQPGVCGIRHLINWHPTDAARRAYPVDLLAEPRWQAGFALLHRYGLSFDFHGFPPQLANLAALARRHPDVPLILDHLALPIAADGLEEWRAGITALAALPQVAIKLSGAGFIHRPFAPEEFRDIVLEVIDHFGTDRVMVATNFPTDRQFADLDTTLGAYEALLAAFSEAERRNMWGRNARRIYRLEIDA